MHKVALERFDSPLFMGDSAEVLSGSRKPSVGLEVALAVIGNRYLKRLPMPQPMQVRSEVIVIGTRLSSCQIQIAISKGTIRKGTVAPVNVYEFLCDPYIQLVAFFL